MKRIQITDAKVGGVIIAKADLPLGTTNGYVQFDFIRSPSTNIASVLGLRLSVAKSGTTSLYVLFNGTWSRIEHATIVGVNAVSVRRMDVFVWEVSVYSGADAALSKTWYVNYQGDFLVEPLDADPVQAASKLVDERNDSVAISIYANGDADIANLDIRAEKNVW